MYSNHPEMHDKQSCERRSMYTAKGVEIPWYKVQQLLSNRAHTGTFGGSASSIAAEYYIQFA